MDVKGTAVTFLGTGALNPTAGHDHACFVVNGRVLVDTGLAAVWRMRTFGLDPVGIDHVILTHRHLDHTVGLPGLLFHRMARAQAEPLGNELTVIGPAEHVAGLLERAVHFLNFPDREAFRMPKVVALEAGGGYECDSFAVTTCAAEHTAPALCYRLRDKATGAEIAFTGDTRPSGAVAEHVKGVALLIHDSTYGARAAEDGPDPGKHSGAPDAARVATAAGVGRLALIHGWTEREWQDAAVAAAREIFPETFWPAEGETVEVAGG